MKYLALVFGLLFALTHAPLSHAGDVSPPPEPVKEFYGVGWQDDGQHWSVAVHLGKKSGKIAYPSLKCSGDWTLVSTTPERLHFIETLTSGLDACIETGDVFLEPLPTGGYHYEWSELGADAGARAILFPVSDEKLSYMEQLLVTLNTVNLDYVLPEFSE